MSNHPEPAGERSIVRHGAAAPRGTAPKRGGGWMWLFVLILLIVFLYFTFAPRRDRPLPKQTPDSGVSLVFLLVPVVSLAGVVLINAWLAAKKRPLNPHGFATALVVACAVAGGVIWLLGQVFLGPAVLVLAVLMAFSFHVFSPFWWHLRTGVYLTNLQR